MNRTALVLICTMLYEVQNNKIVSRLLEPLVPRPQYLTDFESFCSLMKYEGCNRHFVMLHTAITHCVCQNSLLS